MSSDLMCCFHGTGMAHAHPVRLTPVRNKVNINKVVISIKHIV